MAKKKKTAAAAKPKTKPKAKKAPRHADFPADADVPADADLDKTYAVVRIELDEESEFLAMPEVYSGYVGGKHVYDFQITDPEEWAAFTKHILAKAARGSYYLRVVEPLG